MILIIVVIIVVIILLVFFVAMYCYYCSCCYHYRSFRQFALHLAEPFKLGYPFWGPSVPQDPTIPGFMLTEIHVGGRMVPRGRHHPEECILAVGLGVYLGVPGFGFRIYIVFREVC